MPVVDIEAFLKDYKPDPKRHSVMLYLKFQVGKLDDKKALDAVFDLDDLLREVVEKTGVGRFDGNEFCEGPDETSVTFFIYGTDADVIHGAISPVLAYLPSLPGSYVHKIYGGYTNAPEKKVLLR